jgi:putative hemolysin
MIPVHKIVSISLTTTKTEFLDKIKRKFYSRIAVYLDDNQDFCHYVNTRDILFSDDYNLQTYLKDPLYLPESKKADEALFEMQKNQVPLCFVVNEYGNISGMITKENLAELIVGEIEDEMREENSMIKTKDCYIISGWESIDRINAMFALNISKEGFETLNGFISSRLKKIPAPADQFLENNLEFTVLQVENRIASKIKIIDLTQLPKN